MGPISSAFKNKDNAKIVVITPTNEKDLKANPQNYKNPLIIYTAQEAEDVVGINDIFHGPTDYLIVKNHEGIGSGYYIKDKEKWTFEGVEKEW